MKVEKMEHVRIEMHALELEKFMRLLEEVDREGSNMPTWAKGESIELIRKINMAMK